MFKSYTVRLTTISFTKNEESGQQMGKTQTEEVDMGIDFNDVKHQKLKK